MNINRIIADIEVAKRCCCSKNNPTNDEYFYDVAAYHAQQAVEKELKYILHDIYGMDNTSRKFRTHNISTLIVFLGNYEPDFVKNHQGLVDMMDIITDWEASCRYGESIVSTRKDIENAIVIADDLLDEIQKLKLRSGVFENEYDDDYETER